jgi:thiamine biosynthesis protein ThiI
VFCAALSVDKEDLVRNLIMVRYGEIYLKGQNRPFFLKLLVSRIRDALRCQHAKVWLNDSRIYVSDFDSQDECIIRLVKVFGVHSVCPAVEMDKSNFEDICKQATKMMEGLHGTFKVQARRSDKRFFMDSPQINAAVGEYILTSRPDLQVDVRKADHLMNIEIRDNAYLYVKVIPGAGGMPVGSNGKAALLLSGGIDSPVAGYMIAKRGVELCAVHFYSFPYTGERAKDKVLDLARILSVSACGVRVYVVPFTEIQMKIHELCPPDYTTLIMRRCMMRIADRIAEKAGAQVLVTGESIGQVASQTMDALVCTDAVSSRPVFRPLIGFDKVDIVAYAKQIGTYETSCLPYEDCCTVFTPKHPVTHPKIDKTELAEAPLELQRLINDAVENVEITDV